MRKILIITCLLFFSITNYAQVLPDGSIAPNFTVTDINGNHHTLSAYLNAGKTVILEFSGVGCGNSWYYLRTEALQDFYNAYGSPGSNEAVVLFIEASTTVDELKDTYHLGFGNWIEGTPFPMILDTAMHSLYQIINYVPVIYRVCPNGKLTNIGQSPAASVTSLVNNNCHTLSGVHNYARVIGNINEFCGKTGSFKATLKNYGSNNITTATLQLKENGMLISSKKITGNILQFSTETIAFDAVNINTASAYTVELTDINGVSNYNAAFSTATLPFSIAGKTATDLLVKTYTNKCPGQMSWKITNSAGTVIANSDSYGTAAPTCDLTNAGKIMEQHVVLPNAKDCYNLTLISSGGFGWKNYGYDYVYQTLVPGIEIFSNGNSVFSKPAVGNFGHSVQFENFLTTKDSSDFLQITDPATDNAAPIIFPNPSQGIVHIKTGSTVSIRLFNSMGQPVFSAEGIENNVTLNLSKLQNGIYTARIIGLNNKTTVQKLILNN